MKNKYYIDDKGSLTDEQVRMVKRNYIHVAKALNRLYFAALRNNLDNLDNTYKPFLLSGNLDFGDNETGLDTNDLAIKLRFLTISLSENPKNVEKFRNSLLYNGILTPLYAGDVGNPNKQWINYKNTMMDNRLINNNNPFIGALICNKLEPNAPIGLDYSKIIDSFVKVDEYGKYYLSDKNNIQDEVEMLEAVKQYLKDLKSNEIFRKNYKNPLV